MSPRIAARKTIATPCEVKGSRECDERNQVAADDDCEDDIVTLETKGGHTRLEMDKGKEEQETTNVVVTGGALTFVILAAILVTASFLMSPVIEQVFGKRLFTYFLLFYIVNTPDSTSNTK